MQELHLHEQLKLVERHALTVHEAECRANTLTETMETYFGDALVEGWEPLDGTFGLPDPDDEHVVAAAVVGGAGVIVTDNVKDFPRDRVPAHIAVVSGREFAADTTDVDPEKAVQAIREISARRKNPRLSPAEIVDLLVKRYGMQDVADMVTPLLD